jgi:hypothetical protein
MSLMTCGARLPFTLNSWDSITITTVDQRGRRVCKGSGGYRPVTVQYIYTLSSQIYLTQVFSIVQIRNLIEEEARNSNGDKREMRGFLTGVPL